jgi:hypothetical protein
MLQQAATLTAHDHQRNLYLTKTLSSLLDYRCWLKCKVYRSGDVEAFMTDFKTIKTMGEQRRFISDQIRLRQICHGLPKRSKKHSNIPRVARGKGKDGLDACLAEIMGFIAAEPPLTLCAHRAGSNLDKGDQPLDAVAREVEDEHNAEMDRLRGEWFENHPDGAFKACRQKEPDDLRPRAKAAAKHRKRTGGPPTHEQDLYLRAGEHVSVADYQEVMTWVLDSDPVDSRHHIPGLSPALCCDDAITEVDAPAAAKAKAVKRKRPVKNTRKWVADVPGIALVGGFFVDPPEEGQVSLGRCYVVPRPKQTVGSQKGKQETKRRPFD